MNNTVMLVGRLVSDPEIKETEDNKKGCTIKLAIPRAFKNIDGIYETDFIPVQLWQSIATRVCEYVQKGDLIGVRGTLQNTEDNVEVIADKVTFLSGRKSDED